MSAVRADTIVEPYIFEDRARGLFRVNRRVFVDPAILERERRYIFDTCWLYVGHESEVAAKGDFLTRTVGGRELIFVRGKDDRVRAFFNTCPHRGAMVCREKHGNEKMFRCFYHAWAFDLQGKLVNRPGTERYAEGSNVDGVHNLVQVPQLDQYRGLYFVNYDRGAVDLVTYLAGATEFIDLVMDQSEVGMEIVGGTQEYGFAANWKLLCENSIDGYHGMPTHATYFDYVMASGGQLGENMTTVNKPNDLGNGHAVIEYGAPWGRPVAKPVKAWGEKGDADTAEIRARLEKRFGKTRAERIAYQNRNMLIFPNLVINDIMAVTVRTFFPVAPGQQNVSAWALAPKDENEVMRERRLYNYLEFLGPGGFATPDDCEALALCQRGYNNLAMAGWNDISKGMHEANPIIEDEAQMRVFWREWDRRMSGARVVSAPAAKAQALSVTRTELEDFLYLEAALLDDWRLEEWLALFVPGARYLVPPAGSNDDVDPATTLFYVADDYHRLTERVKRLGKKNAHVEFPHSRCRRLVTNVRILGGADDSFAATSNFVTYRSKRGVTETYLGHHRYELCVDAGAIRIRKKTSFIDTDDINAQGKVSIIL